MSAHPTPDLLFDLRADVGEGPSWVTATGQLSFVDITAGLVHVGDLGGVRRTIEIGAHVGAALPAVDGGFLLARRDGFVRLTPDGQQEAVALPLAGTPEVRFNDAKCDPAGRAWGGTMGYADGTALGVLYRLDDGTTTPVVTGLGLANGIGWSPDSSRMYLVDSRAGTIDVMDYDLGSGTASERRPFIDLSAGPGVPDGLCVDDDGCLWVAIWGGSAVRHFAPDGRDLDGIAMPVSQPSSCCFAGDVLVVTTASHGLAPDHLAREPHAGAVFGVRPGVRGPAAVPWPGTGPAGRDGGSAQ